MVRRFLNFFDRELGGLHQAALFLALAAIASKLLALLRDRFLASTFGAGKTLDVYYASFVLPDYLYNFLLFIVSASALIPIFLEKISHSSEEGKKFLDNVLTAFFAITVIFAAILFFFIPSLVPFIAPGFSPEQQQQVAVLSRILLLSPLLLGLSNLISSVIQSLRRFFIYAMAPVFYNIGIILGVLVFYRWWGLTGVVAGVVLGALMHVSIQVPSLLKSGFLPWFTLKIEKSEIKKIVKLSFPRALGLTFNQLVLTVITAIASVLGPGSIAVFNLAINLQTIPLTVVGMSYGVAAFPTLAQFHIKNEREKFLEHVLIAIRHIIFWSFPATVLFIILRAQIVRSVLGAGAFGWADTRLTAASLAILSIAIAGQGLLFLLVRAFYAAGRTKTPLLINFFSSLAIIGGAFLFLWLFKNSGYIRDLFITLLKVEDVSGVKMLILPLVFSLGTIINTFLLLIFFQKDFGKIIPGIKKTAMEMTLASVFVGAVAYIFLALFAHVFNTRTFIGIFLQGLLSGLFGIGAGIIILKFLKNAELKEIISSLRRKIWKNVPIVVPEPEKLP
ncbi:MAG: lipid II flippase MurJ [bacterium]|nr:lipid II flippase MurJ [bacterium]